MSEMRLSELFTFKGVCVKFIEIRERDTHYFANTFRRVPQNLLLV